MKTKLTVLCSANVCRSPVIEAILQKKIKEAGLEDIEVTSMGTDPECGTMYRDPVMVRLAMNYGYTIEGMNRYMTSEDLKDMDLILVMTMQHKIQVQNKLPYHRWGCIRLFNEYCFGIDQPVDDPSHCPEAVYEKTFKHLEKGCRIIVEKLKNGLDPIPHPELY